MSFQTGEVFSDYEVLQVLGAGGMGEVYKVRNTVSGRIEAVKVLPPVPEGDSELADRFLREIRVHAALEHPNIARLYTAQRLGDQILLVMEFVEGTTLEALLSQGRITLDEGAGYACQALSALSYAHDRGVIHRDVKPANMMLTSDETIKLMDFGIAKVAADPRLTGTGYTVGSLYYMSPEQIKGAPELDARSDLYSLGISLYEIVTGKRPFGGDSADSIMEAHLQETPAPPVELDPNLPPALSQLILMSIAKEPAQRFHSAEAFRRALESTGVSVPRPVAAAPPRETASAPAPSTPQETVPATAAAAPPSPRSRRRGLYMLAGSLATLVVIVLAVTQVPKWLKTSADAEEAPAEMSSPSEPAVSWPAAVPEGEEAEALPAVALEPDTGQTAPPPPSETAPAEPSSPGSLQPEPARSSSPPLSPAAQSAVPASVAEPPRLPSPAPARVTGQTPRSPSPDPARVAALRQLDKSMMLMATRIGPVKTSLANIRQSQQRAGLGMRRDIAEAEQRLEYFMDEAESSLRAGNPGAAKKNLDYAERQLETLERFLGR